jgi:hypothetical protein
MNHQQFIYNCLKSVMIKIPVNTFAIATRKRCEYALEYALSENGKN